MKRLSAAGFKSAVARQIVLPDWWDESCVDAPEVLPEVELRVARFVGATLADVRNPKLALASPAYPGAQLRRVKNIDRDRLAPAIHLGLKVAEATVRNWRGSVPVVRIPPDDPLDWRAQLIRRGPVIRLPALLEDLWERGVPVVHIEVRPSPSFQGMVCIVGGRPVIVLAHDLDDPARLAFVVAHEMAHVVAGDCVEGQPVVDEDEVNPDDHATERSADRYAARVLTGGKIPKLEDADPKDLARQALVVEQSAQIDAALVVHWWAKSHAESGSKVYARAALAREAMYRHTLGKRRLREAFDEHIDLEAASESDRALLRCLFLDPERDATGH